MRRQKDAPVRFDIKMDTHDGRSTLHPDHYLWHIYTREGARQFSQRLQQLNPGATVTVTEETW